MPYVEQKLAVFLRDGMAGREMGSYGKVFTVLENLLSADTVCSVTWLVYRVDRYSYFVPLIPPAWRLDVSANVGGRH